MLKNIFKEWDTKYVNDLPDSSFAYISSGGEKDSEGKTKPRSLRHLPYKNKDGEVDLPHVRNALARLDQTDIPESAKAGIKSKLEKILEKNKASEKLVGVFPFQFDEDGDAGEDSAIAIPDTIHLIPIGEWAHDLYGAIVIKQNDIREFVQNFNAKIRKGVFITAGHEGFNELPAVAWIDSVEARDDGLWGKVSWNELGKEALSDKQYKFFSPEFYPTYEDPETHDIYRNVLTGGALTKSPYFKELQAVVFSDKITRPNKFSETMDLNTLIAKDIATLSTEEIAFIKEHQSELTDEQKSSHASVIEEVKDAETAEEKTAREEKEKGDANEAAGLNRDGSAKEVAASEKVMIGAAELAILRSKADKGELAFKELETAKVTASVNALMFSDANKLGYFLPKEKDEVKVFVEALTEPMRAKFSALLAKMPKSTVSLFKENGDSTEKATGAEAELNMKMSEKQKANPKLSYSQALREVFAENADLEKRYNSELKKVGKTTTE